MTYNNGHEPFRFLRVQNVQQMCTLHIIVLVLTRIQLVLEINRDSNYSEIFRILYFVIRHTRKYQNHE